MRYWGRVRDSTRGRPDPYKLGPVLQKAGQRGRETLENNSKIVPEGYAVAIDSRAEQIHEDTRHEIRGTYTIGG